jgi:hypothetical protein
VCYSKKNIILDGSTADCVDRMALSLDSCHGDFIADLASDETVVRGRELKPKGRAKTIRGLQTRDAKGKPAKDMGGSKFDTPVAAPVKPPSGTPSTSPVTPPVSCPNSCTETADEICFRASTNPGLERWYTAGYTVFDSSSGMSYSAGFVAVIKYVAATDPSFNSCDSHYVPCIGSGVGNTRALHTSGLRGSGE